MYELVRYRYYQIIITMLAFINSVAKLCIDKYNSMKKTGKPDNSEWTVLAGIILKNADNAMSVVSLATGTKCLSGVELTNTKFYEIGERLSDSHAEILARRGFLLYLYNQLDLLFSSNNNEVFIINTNKIIEIRRGVSFHFFCSQTPCGDCSIIPMNITETSHQKVPTKKPKLASETTSIETNSTLIEDIYRTGAKCLRTETKQDLRLSGKEYHVTGALRTKPGRGDPTLSLSCSDKIAKWNAVGIQGSLLSTFVLAPIRLKTIVIGGGCPFSQQVMERGIYNRFGDDLAGPDIFQADIKFSCMRNSVRSRPCPTSIVWSAVQNGNTQITVDGRKQGATKSKRGNDLFVSRTSLLKKFLQTLDKSPFANNVPSHPKKIFYYHYKQWRGCSSYQKEWKYLKATRFTAWPEKPMGLQSFSL
ncbi:tRNA-specific adenosine deaminase 1-like isoform X2 [Venturia canescens]|uniref:tRNA-specific adenosine deaminase 1-like isoform X2 n=1 Tax=Venturia canescens TaxID=32260 RepID=UPI001C9C9589|nr:tRNA-specific adenosine deaminase 1-like isoform X2 [Venturia canescens]